MQGSRPINVRWRDRRGRKSEGHSAEIVRLDEWRRERAMKTPLRRPARLVIVPQPLPRRHRISIDLLLIALVVASAAAGAIFALMYSGQFP